MNISSPGLDADTVCPANLEMTDGATVALADIEEPVKDVIVVFGIEDDLIGIVEDGCGFLVDDFGCAEE